MAYISKPLLKEKLTALGIAFTDSMSVKELTALLPESSDDASPADTLSDSPEQPVQDSNTEPVNVVMDTPKTSPESQPETIEPKKALYWHGKLIVGEITDRIKHNRKVYHSFQTEDKTTYCIDADTFIKEVTK